jgi:hypothetical protein
MDGLFGRCFERETFGMENASQPAEDTRKRETRARHFDSWPKFWMRIEVPWAIRNRV